METEVHHRLGDLAAEWDAVVRTMSRPSPFLLSWWVDHAAGDGRTVLVCRDGDDLVGGAALEVGSVGRGPLRLARVRTAGQGPLAPDHLDVVAAPGRADEVAAEVVAWLGRGGARVVDLDGLAADGALAGALAAAGHRPLRRTGAPWTALPDDGEAYLAARPGQLRSTARRTRRRLEGDGAEVRHVAPADAGRALADLARLHDGRWADGSDFLSAWDRFAAAAAVGRADGAVRVSELVSAEGEVVATELDLVVDGPGGAVLAFYQAGRRTEHEWRGAGTALKAAVVMAACDEGLAEYDLLRGDEPYKADWADQRRELLRVRYGVGPVGRAVAAGAAWWTRRQDRRAAAG